MTPTADVKVAARVLVNQAVLRGELARKPCEWCGASKVEGHHEDYSKPLDVVWLCRRCHSARHKGESRQSNKRGAERLLPNRPGLLTLGDVSAYLGVCRQTVWRYTTRRDHPLPAVRLGRRAVRVRPATLAAWVAEEEGEH